MALKGVVGFIKGTILNGNRIGSHSGKLVLYSSSNSINNLLGSNLCQLYRHVPVWCTLSINLWVLQIQLFIWFLGV